MINKSGQRCLHYLTEAYDELRKPNSLEVARQAGRLADVREFVQNKLRPAMDLVAKEEYEDADLFVEDLGEQVKNLRRGIEGQNSFTGLVMPLAIPLKKAYAALLVAIRETKAGKAATPAAGFLSGNPCAVQNDPEFEVPPELSETEIAETKKRIFGVPAEGEQLVSRKLTIRQRILIKQQHCCEVCGEWAERVRPLNANDPLSKLIAVCKKCYGNVQRLVA